MIYSCFAGIGKTTLEQSPKGGLFKDLESSDYQWIYDADAPTDAEGRKGNIERTKNPDFPQNYVDAIEHEHKYGYHVLISSQPEVLEEIKKRNLPLTTVLPQPSLKDEYIERYKERGNPEGFIELMDKMFEQFTNDLLNNDHAICSIVINQPNTFLSDVIG